MEETRPREVDQYFYVYNHVSRRVFRTQLFFSAWLATTRYSISTSFFSLDVDALTEGSRTSNIRTAWGVFLILIGLWVMVGEFYEIRQTREWLLVNDDELENLDGEKGKAKPGQRWTVWKRALFLHFRNNFEVAFFNISDMVFGIVAILVAGMALRPRGWYDDIAFSAPKTLSAEAAVDEVWVNLIDRELYWQLWFESSVLFGGIPLLYLLMTVRVLKFCRFHIGLSLVSRTLTLAAYELQDVALITLGIIAAVAACIYSIAGVFAGHPNYTSFGYSFSNTGLLSFGFYDAYDFLNQSRGERYEGLGAGNVAILRYILLWLLLFLLFVVVQNVFIGIVTTAYDKARAGTEAYLGTNASGELAVYEGFPRFLGRMIVYSLYCAVWVIKQAASRTERSSQLGMKRMISAKTNARKAAWSWRSRKRGTGAQDEQAAGALTVEPPATDSAAEDAMLSPRPDWSGNPEAMVARAFGSKQESVGTAKVHPLPHSESSNLSARKLRRFMTKDQLMEERSKKPSWFSWKDGFKAFMLCASSKAGTVYDLISAPHDTPYIDSSDRMYLITVGELTRLFRREDLRHRPLSFWGYRWEYFPGVVGFEETLLRLLGTAEVDHMPPALAHIAEGSGAGPPTPGPGPSSSSKVEPESLPATGEPSRKEGSVTKIAW